MVVYNKSRRHERERLTDWDTWMAADRHHILFSSKAWRLYPESTKIREHPSLIPTIPREIHEALHDACPPVPPLGWQTLCRVAKYFYPSRDILQTMDEVCYAIDKAAEHPSVHPIERSVAELAIQAVQIQKPFIEEGLVIPNGATVIDLASRPR